ncbi:hypothetical protein JCM10207_001669 [Rhodosporidiobolus poonsookiae]
MALAGSYTHTNLRYASSLSSALDAFHQLVANPASTGWKQLAQPPDRRSFSSSSTSAPLRPKPSSSAHPLSAHGQAQGDDFHAGLSPLPLGPNSVTVHRKADKATGCDIVRAVAEVSVEQGREDEVVERARAVLGTGELRGFWDKLVEQQTTLELLDPQTRIVKTDYRLGWPASPRDTITITRTLLTPSSTSTSSSSSSASPPSPPPAASSPSSSAPTSPPTAYSPGPTLIDLSVSLPRASPPSPSTSSSAAAAAQYNDTDEPAFLRPAPPFVRAQLHLGAWVVQILPPLPSSSSAAGSGASRLRLTYFWQWNLRLPTLAVGVGGGGDAASAPARHAQELVASFLAFLRSSLSPASASSAGAQVGMGVQADRVPLLRGYGRGVELNRDEYDVGAETRAVEYAVVFVPPASSSSDGGEGEEGEGEAEGVGANLQGLDELARRRERRRLERSVEVALPRLGVRFDPLPSAGGEGSDAAPAASGGGGAGDGWDVRIIVKPLGGSSASLAPSAEYAVSLSAPALSPSSTEPAGPLALRVTHAPLAFPAHLVRATVRVQRLAGAGASGVRVNGERVGVHRVVVGGREPGVGQGQLGLGWTEERASVRSGASGDSAAAAAGASGAGESAVSLRSVAPSPATQRATQLAALLRRSYIYFLSLLQEPPAKWRAVSDSQGVTVTQLLSPDPTLTIYRAEAVFVGVGVWDVFATVVTQGVRRTWDRGIEGVELVVGAGAEEEGDAQGDEGEGAGLSEVWWERRKGQWPVAPRDSILLRTAYKSPSSIHVFSSSPPSSSSPSSSSPDASLFPSLPPPAPGTIRTHTDLLGWSIEALSPTTTQITLLDQSDPRGWSSKSSYTPSALVTAVAGVRDWTIRHGAPPVVTRLSGAGVRKTRDEYDPDRAALRVEYAPAPVASSPALALASPPSSPPLGSSPSSAPAAPTSTASTTIECEIRCDATTWSSPSSASSIDVVIDPPPLRVAALSRHRLSAGGGLWLTIEHSARAVRAEGKVGVTVRRAPGSSAGGGGSGGGGAAPVTVNGARVKVDVEVLDDDKVRELEKRKRVKVRPVPLDQYQTLGPRTGTPAAAPNAAVAASTPAGAAATGEKGPAGGKEDGKEEKSAGGAGGGVTDDPGAAVALIEPSVGDTALTAADGASAAAASTTAPAPAPPLDPPASALEALAWLQTFHAEQGPELTDPAPGWAIVSERGGTVVRKKVLSRISPELPVFRGDKVVQGLTADEIASVVTAPGCRKAWDERVESAVPLASYGNGISTMAVTTKPAFPFKGRLFYVASVNASVKVPSASSAASTSTVLFVASASYTPSASDSGVSPTPAFDPLKVNPSALPTGTVHLEGWILETLDPYTSSVLAIPSTRCTYVSCVDARAGSLSALSVGLGSPALSVNLARTIAAVEAFGKTRGPVPRLWTPAAGVQIDGPLGEEEEGERMLWRLSDGGAAQKRQASVVAVDYDPAASAPKVVAATTAAGPGTGGASEGGAFRALFKVGGKAEVASEGSLERKASVKVVGGTSGGNGSGAGKSKPSPMLSPSMPVGSTLLKSELPRSASLNFGTAAPPVLHKTPITSELAHKSSRGSLRSRSPPGVGLATPSAASPALTAPAPIAGAANATVKGATSSTTVTDPAAHDLVVAELVIDLKQYPHGYSVSASSLLLPASSAQGAGDAPLSLESLPPRSLAPSSSSSSSSSTTPTAPPTQIPLRCTAHDAPLPSILTASLDAWKRANHLVRVLVPTGVITHPIQDPLRAVEKDVKPDGAGGDNGRKEPEWFRLLMDGDGALVEIKVVPLPAPPASASVSSKAKREREQSQEAPTAAKVTGQAARSAVFNGEKVTVLSQKESKAVLARFEDDDAPLQGPKISRVPPPKRRRSSVIAEVDPSLNPSSSLPLELQQPLAVAVRLLAPKPVTPTIDDFEFPDPKSPGSVTPADDGSRSPVLGGKTALKPSIARRDTASSADGASTGGPLLNILNSYPLSRLGTSVINATAPVTEATLEGGAVAVRRTYTLSFVLLVAVIAFLLGSLLRSLLTPADYIIYRPSAAAAHAEVEQALLTAFDPHRRWREARRLLELRSPWSGLFSWDIIVAAVKRE